MADNNGLDCENAPNDAEEPDQYYYMADVMNANDYYPFGMLMPGRRYSADGAYRFGFNNKEKVDEIASGGYNFGSRIYSSRIGRFLSCDRYEKKFPDFSSYSFADNRPISAIDNNGDSLYVLFYTTGNKRGDEMFQAAALTRQYDIENSKGFDNKSDKVVLVPIQDLAAINAKVNDVIHQYSKTYGDVLEFGLWSHSSLDGPVGTIPTSENKLGEGADAYQMNMEGCSSVKFNWSGGGTLARAGFYGCRSGTQERFEITPAEYALDGLKVKPAVFGFKPSFVEKISASENFLNVSVLGQKTYSFDLKFTNFRSSSKISNERFILSTDTQSGVIKFSSTYLIGGVRKREDFLLNDQDLAFPMRVARNGETVGFQFQTGERKK